MMIKKLFLGLAFYIIQNQVFSQGLFDSISAGEGTSERPTISWNGFARGMVFGAGEKYNYASLFGEFSIQSSMTYKSSFLYTDLRFRGGYLFDRDTIITQIKELYGGYRGNKLDIFFGNQIVQWGRTDGFNPTNSITPVDYFFLTPDIDDQKLSNTMLRLKYRFNTQIELDLIGIPVFKPSVYRYDLFSITEGAYFTKAKLPGIEFKNGSIAARLNFEYTQAGFSFSYFNGYDPFYGYRVDDIDLTQGYPVIRFIPDFYRKQTFGADYAIPFGSWITRGEIAYNRTSDYADSMYIPNPDIAYVFGLEKSIMGITTIIQYIGKYVINFTTLETPVLTDPNNPEQQIQYALDKINYESSLFNRKIFTQQEEFNHALFLSINRSFLQDAFRLELSGYYNFTSEEYLIRPSITWKVNDILQVGFGGNYMKGPENSVFDLSGSVLNGIFAELRVSY
jgi:hypothetical protein